MLDPALAFDDSTMPNATPQNGQPQNLLPANPYQSDRITVVVDRQHFIHTRNAVSSKCDALVALTDAYQ
jgi:hypothetical protein